MGNRGEKFSFWFIGGERAKKNPYSSLIYLILHFIARIYAKYGIGEVVFPLKYHQQFAGYATARGIGSYRASANVDPSPSSSTFKNHMSFSSLGMLSRITEVENESGGASGLDDTKVGNSNYVNSSYGTGFPFGSWNDSTNFGENFNGIKREFDNDGKAFVNNEVSFWNCQLVAGVLNWRF